MNATDGFKIQKNIGTTGAPNWTDQIMLDTNGDAQFGGNVIIGSGNNVVKMGAQGIQAGHSAWSSASFRVDMLGNAVLNKLTADTATFNNSTFNNGEIKGTSINVGNGKFRVTADGTMTATGANISGNITMSGGTISWGSVGAPSYSQIGGSKPPSNADNTYGQLIGNGFTYIGSKYIYTETIAAEKITGGELTAINQLTIGSFSDQNSIKRLRFNSGASISTMSDNIGGGGYSALNISGRIIKLEANYIDFNNANINGLNVVAVFS